MLFSFRSGRRAGQLEKPFRAEILSREAMAQRAVELAEPYSFVHYGSRGVRLQARFRENTRVLNAAYYSFSEADKNKEVLTAGAEWLLDNYHVIDEQVQDIKRDLPKGYYKALPKLSIAEASGCPRVYKLVCDFISHTDATIETDILAAFIQAFQSRCFLKIGEIWAVPIMLRLALVENLRRLAQASLQTREHRKQAEKFCQETIDPLSLSGAEMLIAIVNRYNQDPSIIDHGASYILRRLRARGAPAALSLQWFDEKVRERGIDPNDLARREQQSQAADQISVGNSVTALKQIGSLNWREWFERVSVVDQELLKDPANIYSLSDFITRDLYRHKIEVLARRAKRPEIEIAEEVVATAVERVEADGAISSVDIRHHHVGYYLIDDGFSDIEKRLKLRPTLFGPFKRWCKQHAFPLYIGTISLFVAAGLWLAMWYSERQGAPWWWYVCALLFFTLPLSEFAILLTQWFVTKLTAPLPLPKMDFEKGVPDYAKTLVAVQTITPHKEALERTVESLEIRAIGNDDPNIIYALLADLPDADAEVQSGDRGLVRHAIQLIDELNQRYCQNKTPRFYVLFRKRLWNEKENRWMAWERKRGKIEEFNRLLRGDDKTTFSVIAGGPLENLRNIRYVITLDNDTQLPPQVARKLIGAMAHPLNRAIIDEKTRKVVKGYGVIQPRVGIRLQSGTASEFSRIFSGHSGLDPYTRTVSDVYQDLFLEGSYVGKGIYDVDAFEAALGNRVPQNALLSHDLFEGLFARVALGSDIELFDEFPSRYHAHARRQHRWIRGDWQLVPWIGNTLKDADGRPYPSCVSALGRWKLIDNLRRSLVPISLFLALLCIWAWAPGSQWVWLAGLLVVVGFPVYMTLLGALLDPPIGYSVSTYMQSLLSDLKKSIQQVLLQFILLPHQALLSWSAISVTLYRVFISRRHLLEWETADAAERRLGGDFKSFFSFMSSSLLLVLCAASVLFLVPEAKLWFALPFFIAWYLSPVIAWWISLPSVSGADMLSLSSKDYLWRVAYDTWNYFDSFLKPEYNYLIPDNLQVVPKRVVAERTSPTNISLSVLSTISAYDLGFIPLGGAVGRLTQIFGSLNRLERFHGHFLNWYDIRGLRALGPRYVSMVDSGNLLGHFVAAREALTGFEHLPLLGKKHIEHVLLLTEGTALAESDAWKRLKSISQGPTSLKTLIGVIQDIDSLRVGIESTGASEDILRVLSEYSAMKAMVAWASFLPLIKRLSEKEILNKKLKNIDAIIQGRTPTLSLIYKITNRLLKIENVLREESLKDEIDKEDFRGFVRSLRECHDAARELSVAVRNLISDMTKIIDEIDFKFLFDQKKKLFVIGYNVESGKKDTSYYDLLASEARLGSFVAVAQGQLPQSHWFVLNRALTNCAGGKALLSWSATMFEYLMPLLVMADYPSTLLSETYRSVVRSQQAYARRRGVPWGISESAYSGVDFHKTYQYRAFGVPGLGLKRGLGDDLVISPYSTLLAVIIDPLRAVKNLRWLEKEGARGEFGFYEAIDYTRERLSAEERRHVVKSFLAHHQGMSLVSINNYLNDGIFQKRFHSSALVRSSELLLQERFPRKIPIIVPHQAELSRRERETEESRMERGERIHTAHTTWPRTRVLSNGAYSLVLDNGGGSASSCKEFALTRWRDDGVGNDYGTFVYVKDLKSQKVWSSGYEPTRVEPEEYEVLFNPDKVEYKRRDFGVSMNTEVTVSPEDNVEVRRISLTNATGKLKEIELTSYGEVVLAPRRADLSHPAFSKMFIESEYSEECEALIFSRRPRHEKEPRMFLMHLVNTPVVWSRVQYETSRQKFLGRGGSPLNPQVIQGDTALSGTTGTVLDPIFSLRIKVEIEPGDSQTVTFVTGVGNTKEEVIQLARKYREGQPVTRAFELAWSHSDVELRHQQFSIKQATAFQQLANAIIFNIESMRATSDVIKKNKLSQSALWRFGISGDEPIVLIALNDPDQSKLAQEVLLAHEYLRLRGIKFDLVILNEYPGGYLQNLQEELDFMIHSGYSRDFVERRGGVFLRNLTQLSEEEVILLFSVANVVLYGNRGALATQLSFAQKIDPVVARKKSLRSVAITGFKPPAEPLQFPNGIGGFSDEGKSYTMTILGNQLPPQPWSNVVANKEFGFLITESGAGFTWSDNSRENRMTPWSNDPVSDPFGEVVYIRDQESGAYWSPTPRPVLHGEKVKVKHAFGYSEFTTQVNQIFSKLTVSGSTSEKVKWWHLELVNGDMAERKLEIFLYLEWLLGVSREEHGRHIQGNFDSETQILYATNPYNIDFNGQVAFVGSSQVLHSFTTSKREFIGRHGDPSCPEALEQPNLSASLGHIFAGTRSTPVRLSGQVGGGFDSCAALKVQVTLAPGERQHVLFYIGQTNTLVSARNLAGKFRSLRNWSNAFEQVKRHWTATTNTVQVNTPERKFDIMANGWLQYQTLSGRLLARSGFFQSSGALGFRDQLQDSLALLLSRPEDVRSQILLNASRQFPEGDVQHWWHPPTGRGIRTKISDNYLWLPYAVERYLEATEDSSILSEKVSFIEGPQLQPEEMDIYITPRVSNQQATIYEHCVLALDRAMVFGQHGIPLIGAGDWNDGLNNVGVQGKGESIWLGWFLAGVLSRFAAIVEARNDVHRAGEYRARSRQIVQAIENQGWDGEWYRRAYFDDGSSIGSSLNQECRIDSIAQSWSVISGLADRERQKTAMEAVYRELVKKEDKMVLLLAPPFDKSVPNPGYIQGYPPGLRENGGQYTHAAAWVVMAAAMLGHGSKAYELFEMLNPISHGHSLEEVGRYQTEPYVTCGDVYSVPPHNGRGGWSWYTGSSGWLYQVAIEHIMGLKVRGSYFMVDPCIPANWPGYVMEYRHAETVFRVRVLNPHGVQRGVKSIVVDGQNLDGGRVIIAGRGEACDVVVTLG